MKSKADAIKRAFHRQFGYDTLSWTCSLFGRRLIQRAFTKKNEN